MGDFNIKDSCVLRLRNTSYLGNVICNDTKLYILTNNILSLFPIIQYKLAIIAALFGSAAAFTPASPVRTNTAISQHIGSGGMADTRDPDTKDDEDPRKSISAAPSFEEYLKQREAEGK